MEICTKFTFIHRLNLTRNACHRIRLNAEILFFRQFILFFFNRMFNACLPSALQINLTKIFQSSRTTSELISLDAHLVKHRKEQIT